MGCQNFPEMINFWSTFLLCLSSIISFSKKSKQLFSSRYCGSRNFCKKHDIIKPNFYTILHNLASNLSILKYTSNAYVFGYFAFWYQIWNWIVSGILFFKINVPLLVDTLRLQKYAKLYCLSNFIYLWSFWDWHSFANSNSAWRRLEYSNRKKSDNFCVFLHTFLTRKM